MRRRKNHRQNCSLCTYLINKISDKGQVHYIQDEKRRRLKSQVEIVKHFQLKCVLFSSKLDNQLQILGTVACGENGKQYQPYRSCKTNRIFHNVIIFPTHIALL